MRLSSTAKILMRGDTEFRDEIMRLNKIKTYNTFYVWLEDEDSKFLLPNNLARIRARFGITDEQIFNQPLEMELQESDVQVEPIENYKNGLKTSSSLL